jgi:mannose/cellobiose epimerase-like protein (N-acyl-D-glucosamine 2-epimerase family)
VNYPFDYRSRDFLLKQISNTLALHDPRIVDPAGGFYHCSMNDGELFNPGLRTLVVSCRFVFNYARSLLRAFLCARIWCLH